MTKKRSTSKLLIVGLIIVLTILLILEIFFFQKSTTKEKENQMERSSLINTKNNCSNCKKEVFTNDKFCSFCGKQINYQDKESHIQNAQAKIFHNWIKIQKTTSGKYFVKWRFDAVEDKDTYHSYLEEGKNCFSAAKMPKILALHQECWEITIEVDEKKN